MSARDTAVILLSLLSCLTTSLGVALALSLRENARALAAGICSGASCPFTVRRCSPRWPSPWAPSSALLPSASRPPSTPNFLAFAAGAMLFVSVHELVPTARRYPRGNFFFLGILLSALIYALLAGMTVG